MAMEKWYQEEYTWTVEVIGYLRGNTPEGYCRNGEEIGDRYTCTYGCPVNQAGQGICSKVMGTLFPLMEAVRSGGDLRNVGGSGKYTKDVVCPDGCVIFRLTATPTGEANFFRGGFLSGGQDGPRPEAIPLPQEGFYEQQRERRPEAQAPRPER